VVEINKYIFSGDLFIFKNVVRMFKSTNYHQNQLICLLKITGNLMQCGLLACDDGAYQTAVLVTSHSACLKHSTFLLFVIVWPI